MPTHTAYKVGVDIGGTFTDIVILGTDGSIGLKKISSTPADYSLGIVKGINHLLLDLGLGADRVEGVVHATTVAANTILEQKGARTALITSRGFRDVLEMRRLRIPVMYDIQYEKPAPLVPRNQRLEVDQRLGPRGEVLKELSPPEVEAVASSLKRAGVQAMAVCFLHSHANPEPEHEVAEIIRRICGNDVYITCSADILPEIREYERFSTAVVNSYIGPIVERYLNSIVKRFQRIGLEAPIQIMHSAGGVMTIEAAVRKPAYLVESGPAAGVIACARLAAMAGHDNVISFDMGGTTAKTGIIENGQPAKTTEYEVGAGINLSSKLVKGGGYPIKLPFIDVSEIGAGGGSIVNVDSSGRITVGPRSAGANPGPICYDLGGEEPTFTDAVLILGYINPKYLANGDVRLNAAKAKREFEIRVARPLGMSTIDAAFGVFTLGCATMMRAVKAVSTYRGRDPRDYVLVAFGGNGPVVAAEIARSLGIGCVLIPPAPGVFSALGLLYSDVEYEFIQTLFLKSDQVTSMILDEAYNRLEEEARATMQAEDYPIDSISISRFADLRYSGQAYELTIKVSQGQPRFEQMTRDFGREHELTYDHKSDSDPVDVVNIKVVASLRSGQIQKTGLSPIKYRSGNKGLKRLVSFGPDKGLLTTPVISRIDLAESSLNGPVIIEESDSTCVVPPGCLANLDSAGNIIITLEGN